MRLQDALYIKRTCPNCIKKFYPGDCRIISTTTKGKVLAAAPTGWKQILARINPVPLNRDYVLELASRECPHCHYYLPVNIERVENISIAVVGDTFSGKSHYIAALIHQMRQGEIQRIDQFTRFDCLTQGIESEYIRDVMKPLFEDKQSPPPTQMSTDPHRPPLNQHRSDLQLVTCFSTKEGGNWSHTFCCIKLYYSSIRKLSWT